MISSSELVCNALSLDAVGVMQASQQQRCGMCGGMIKQGDLIDEMSFPSTFGMHKYLFDIHASNRCGFCSTVMEQHMFLQDLSSGVYHKDGFIPVAKKVNRGYAIAHPPPPPYVFVIQADRSQHMIWRAAVCHSDSVIKLLCGDRVHQIRRRVLTEAINHARELQATWLSLQKNTKKKPMAPVSFIDIDAMKGKKVGIGEIQNWVIKLADEGAISAGALDSLHAMNHSEAWALGITLGDIEESPAFKSIEAYTEAKKLKKSA